MRPLPWLLGLLCGPALLAQAGPTFTFAYPDPQAGWKESNNVIPLGGVGGASNFSEARWLQILPRHALPPLRGRIVSLAPDTNAGTFELSYHALQISLALRSKLALEDTFDANLEAPLLFVDQRDAALRFENGQATRLPPAGPFVYDGASHLVVDIQKRVDPASVAAHAFPAHVRTFQVPAESGIPSAMVSTGGVDSGAAQGDGRRLHLSMHVGFAVEFTPLEDFGAQRERDERGEVLRLGFVARAGTCVGLRFEGAVSASCVLGAAPWSECEVRVPCTTALLGIPLRIERLLGLAATAWSSESVPRPVDG